MQSKETDFTEANTQLIFKVFGIIAFLILGISAFTYFSDVDQGRHASASISSGLIEKKAINSFPIVVPTIKYGFALDTFQVTLDTIENNQYLAEILLPQGMSYGSIDQLARNVQDTFSVTKLRAGKEFTILTRDTANGADYFIYEPDVYSYVIYDLKALTASIKKRQVTTIRKESAGIINSSLWMTMKNNGLSLDLIDKMEGIFQWSLDFHHIQPGDRFKVIYNEDYIDGKPVGVSSVEGGFFQNYENKYYGIYYENGKYKGFYDEKASTMKSPFLKAPIKFSQFRISSSFNPRRFHPVLKRVRPHFGTDYAAAYGTPIVAVADGTVSQASQTAGNGRYVKIRHDKVYETQYLHMQGFAKGIHTGVRVKQGQVIGYVGSSGLATGPHVCFRFWKNGQQVDHLRLKLPNSEPMPEKEKPLFYPIRDRVVQQLDAIVYPEVQEEVKEEVQEVGQEISDLM